MEIGSLESAKRKNIEVFCCYARKDQQLLLELKTHLTPLVREGLITLWADVNIDAGMEWEKEIHRHLSTAHIILLLISPDFMASDYCYSVEMQRAMERHERGEACVIPIILRPVSWQRTPFGKLQVLPADASPIISGKWHYQDEAFYTVVEGIRDAVEARKAEEERQRKAEEQAHKVAEQERLRKAKEEEERTLAMEKEMLHGIRTAHLRKTGEQLYKIEEYASSTKADPTSSKLPVRQSTQKNSLAVSVKIKALNLFTSVITVLLILFDFIGPGIALGFVLPPGQATTAYSVILLVLGLLAFVIIISAGSGKDRIFPAVAVLVFGLISVLGFVGWSIAPYIFSFIHNWFFLHTLGAISVILAAVLLNFFLFLILALTSKN